MATGIEAVVIVTAVRRLGKKAILCDSGLLRQGKLANVLLFRSAVAAQQLRKVLGERRARQHHVASDFVRFLLQIALHVGEKSNDRSSLF